MLGDAAEGKTVGFTVATLRGNVSGAEGQAARIRICVGGRRPEVAVRTSTAETTAPVEIARQHNRKRKAAESSGRKMQERGIWSAEESSENLLR